MSLELIIVYFFLNWINLNTEFQSEENWYLKKTTKDQYLKKRNENKLLELENELTYH